jgi:dTDP-glucose 4,6-dehydratase
MKILVTGGQGVVGSGLVRELIRRGFKVISCDTRHDENQIGYSVGTDIPNASYVRCDVSEYRQLRRLFERHGPFDFVYHCAAEFGRWNGEDYYEQLWKTNCIGTKNIIRMQEEFKFKLIHFSSSEVYGDWHGIMEEGITDLHEIKQMNDYAISKWVNEMQIKNSIVLNKLDTVVVRLFNTYGPGEYYSPYRSVNSRFIYLALNNLPFTVYRGHRRTSTYLPDTINTLCNITNNFISGETYNIGGRELHSIEDLASIILEVTRADSSLVIYKDSEKLTTTDKIVDVSKSEKDLNHKNSVSLREGIENTVKWMRKEYNILNQDISLL